MLRLVWPRALLTAANTSCPIDPRCPGARLEAGASYGFEVIPELAAKIESALVGVSSVADVRGDVDDFMKLCLQVRSL